MTLPPLPTITLEGIIIAIIIIVSYGKARDYASLTHQEKKQLFISLLFNTSVTLLLLYITVYVPYFENVEKKKIEKEWTALANLDEKNQQKKACSFKKNHPDYADHLLDADLLCKGDKALKEQEEVTKKANLEVQQKIVVIRQLSEENEQLKVEVVQANAEKDVAQKRTQAITLEAEKQLEQAKTEVEQAQKEASQAKTEAEQAKTDKLASEEKLDNLHTEATNWVNQGKDYIRQKKYTRGCSLFRSAALLGKSDAETYLRDINKCQEY